MFLKSQSENHPVWIIKACNNCVTIKTKGAIRGLEAFTAQIKKTRRVITVLSSRQENQEAESYARRTGKEQQDSRACHTCRLSRTHQTFDLPGCQCGRRPDAVQGRRDRLVADTGFGSGLCTIQPALEVVEASLNSGLEAPVSIYSPPKLREARKYFS